MAPETVAGGYCSKLPNIEVIAVVSNPRCYESRYRLYKTFADDLKQQSVNVRLWTVELQHGVRPARVTHSHHENHIQLWTSALPGEIWHKENLINIALNHLTKLVPDWRYVAWVDADFKFEPDAFKKTIEALQHYDLVQMWSHLINLDPRGCILNNGVGISYMYALMHAGLSPCGEYPAWLGSPGGAWAARRESLNKLGTVLGSPLIDWNILGSGDLYFVECLNGLLKVGGGTDTKNLHKYSKAFVESIEQFQDTAVRELKKNIGCVENTVRHMWHGRQADKKYGSRGDILIKYQFNPLTDLKRDVSGVYQLVVGNERQIRLRDACRAYFYGRNEDTNVL
jgi:hypothetical protein